MVELVEDVEKNSGREIVGQKRSEVLPRKRQTCISSKALQRVVG